jgi:hypothetical protein
VNYKSDILSSYSGVKQKASENSVSSPQVKLESVDKHICSVIVWSYLGFIGLLSRAANPFGKGFLHTIVPALLVLTSLQCLLLLKKLGWQIAGVCAALSAGVLIELSRRASGDLHLLLLSLGGALAVQLAVLWFLAPDSLAKRIVLMVTIAVCLIISTGAYLSFLRPDFHLPRTGIFLFWSPLVAMATWVSGVVSGWTKSTQIFFICLVAQSGIGFFDLGTSLGETWMHAFAVVFGFIALGFIFAWADDLNK